MEAFLYDKLESGAVKCRLCGWRCTIQPGKRGVCNVRENRNGTLESLVYGRAISYAVDPIEKKPLYHFHPGAFTFSIATVGCNFRCNFCDNWSISQERQIVGDLMLPEEVVFNAQRMKCSAISYTYTEPTIFFEYAYDTAKFARSEGLLNTFVTNGFMSPEAIDMVSPYLDAATVDFKGSADPAFYKNFCGITSVEPIFDSLLEMKRKKIFIEITNLIVPGEGDGKEPYKKLLNWILDNLGPDTPLHLLRFFSSYRYEGTETTQPSLLEEYWQMASDAGFHYVYLGNAPGHKYENTRCPSCGKMVIERFGFEVAKIHLTGKRCAFCGHEINIIL
ncbi:MAG: AmmeMemoRadiSam system radical SAM enzyme [Candidatus Methanomethylicus sp.]|nr:AmmeMemoRadiSam system radical SAM enzyme [Candidatus Methanomethylicus sp.]